ncbi:MAG: hypothetical protein OEY59_11860, partial [Deltaproteobacteria bacterium]|nr:hypothetical protein [Deltaproteobacteria bacterium]
MVEASIKKISNEIEYLTKNNIQLLRALDILEASTQDLEEIIVINLLRESYKEIGGSEPNLT